MSEKSDKPAKKTPTKKAPAPRKPRAKADEVKVTPKVKKPEGMTDAEFEKRVLKVLEDFFSAPENDYAEQRPSRWARFFGIK